MLIGMAHDCLKDAISAFDGPAVEAVFKVRTLLRRQLVRFQKTLTSVSTSPTVSTIGC